MPGGEQQKCLRLGFWSLKSRVNYLWLPRQISVYTIVFHLCNPRLYFEAFWSWEITCAVSRVMPWLRACTKMDRISLGAPRREALLWRDVSLAIYKGKGTLLDIFAWGGALLRSSTLQRGVQFRWISSPSQHRLQCGNECVQTLPMWDFFFCPGWKHTQTFVHHADSEKPWKAEWEDVWGNVRGTLSTNTAHANLPQGWETEGFSAAIPLPTHSPKRNWKASPWLVHEVWSIHPLNKYLRSVI